MFCFVFDKLKVQPKNWKFIINDYEINCSKANAELISQKINRFCKQHPGDLFKICIHEFEDPLFCSQTDYQIFSDVFNLIKIPITSTNKDLLKIFAQQLKIEELLNLVEMYERSYDIIINNQILHSQKEISNDLINLNSTNYEELINKIINIYKKEKEDKYIIIDNEFLYNSSISSCTIRPDKIELIISFLKELESKTAKCQFKFFQKEILAELHENRSNEIRFIIRYLYHQKELDSKTIIPYISHSDGRIKSHFKDIIFDQIEFDHINNKIDLSNKEFNQKYMQNSKEFEKYDYDKFLQYVTKGTDPDPIYQAILNDDLELFSQKINEKAGEVNYNDHITPLIFERNSRIFNEHNLNYIDACAIHGSEKIFNFILLNVESETNVSNKTIYYAFCSGNVNIIHKCINEKKSIDREVFYQSLLGSIQYNRNELFEWLIENHFPKLPLLKTPFNELTFLEYSIRYNNFDALYYLFSIGNDYQPLFSLSMLYNNFYLAELALKLQYNCNSSSNKLQVVNHSPFVYKLEGI